MGFLGKDDVVVVLPEHRFDYINLDDFRTKSCFSTFAYITIFAGVVIAVITILIDIYILLSLHILNEWASAIKPIIPFDVAKWIFTACIALSFALLFVAWIKAIRVIRAGGIASNYLDPIGVHWSCLFGGVLMKGSKDRSDTGYKRFLVFKELTSKRSNREYLALFAYYGFQGWIRVIFAEGPRQVINLLTIISVFRANLIPTEVLKGEEFSAIMKFFENFKGLAEKDLRQALVIAAMCFSLLVWVFSILKMILAAVLYVSFLWHLMANHNGLHAYCKSRIDKRMKQIVQDKMHDRYRKELKKQPTLANMSDEKKNGISVSTTSVVSPSTNSVSTPASEYKSTIPPRMPIGGMKRTPTSSSNAPLIGNQADMGYSDLSRKPSAGSTFTTKSGVNKNQYQPPQPFNPNVPRERVNQFGPPSRAGTFNEQGLNMGPPSRAATFNDQGGMGGSPYGTMQRSQTFNDQGISYNSGSYGPPQRSHTFNNQNQYGGSQQGNGYNSQQGQNSFDFGLQRSHTYNNDYDNDYDYDYDYDYGYEDDPALYNPAPQRAQTFNEPTYPPRAAQQQPSNRFQPPQRAQTAIDALYGPVSPITPGSLDGVRRGSGGAGYTDPYDDYGLGSRRISPYLAAKYGVKDKNGAPVRDSNNSSSLRIEQSATDDSHSDGGKNNNEEASSKQKVPTIITPDSRSSSPAPKSTHSDSSSNNNDDNSKPKMRTLTAPSSSTDRLSTSEDYDVLADYGASSTEDLHRDADAYSQTQTQPQTQTATQSDLALPQIPQPLARAATAGPGASRSDLGAFEFEVPQRSQTARPEEEVGWRRGAGKDSWGWDGEDGGRRW